MIKVLERIRLEGTYFNIEKDICENTIAIHILRGEKLEAIPLKSGKIHGFPQFTLLFYLVLEVLLRAIIKGKEIERILTGKGKVKLSLFADNAILYLGNTQKSHQKTYVNFSMVTGYKSQLSKISSLDR